MEEFDELFENDNEEVRVNGVPKKYIRDMQNPLEVFEDTEFQRRYRFQKNYVTDVILPLVQPNLEKNCNRGLPIPPILQILVALRFYGSNSFQLIHGDVRGLSQSTVCRIIRNVSVCLAEQLNNYIFFPRDDNSFTENTAAFYRIANFPRVSGCIDCTYIRIENPGGDQAEVFRNRKGWFSLNVQVVCGLRLEILDIVVRHPGSTHDSVIFNRSAVRTRLELQQIPGLLLGDKGYACHNYLLTPVINPITRAEQRYNSAHIRTRNLVERVFGIWKRRFSCLKGGLRTRMETSVAIICATAVLYNLGIFQNQNGILDDEYNDEDEIARLNNQDGLAGLAFRRAFINTHFNIN